MTFIGQCGFCGEKLNDDGSRRCSCGSAQINAKKWWRKIARGYEPGLNETRAVRIAIALALVRFFELLHAPQAAPLSNFAHFALFAAGRSVSMRHDAPTESDAIDAARLLNPSVSA